MRAIPKISWASGSESVLPSELQGRKKHVHIGTNAFQNKVQDVWLNDIDRNGHVNVLGMTGMGKSNLMKRMIHQDIAVGKAVGFIDPNGDAIEDIIANSIPKNRRNDVVLLDMHDADFPVALNLLAPISGVPHKEIAGQALSIIRKMFADQWSQVRMEDTFYAVLIALLSVEGTTIDCIPSSID